ncbi:MAG: MerR family transcriptional regulator [Microbacterium sp.]
MAAAGAERSASALLSIGQVQAQLTEEFPDLRASKLRHLEEQGIVTPQRTAAGYRKFTQRDVERVRFALILQRDHYLPLGVIREHLKTVDFDIDEPFTLPTSIHPVQRSYRRSELLAQAGAAPQLLNDAISIGLLRAADSYDEDALALLQALVALDRHGIEPRHLRQVRQSADKSVDLVRSALGALLTRSDAPSRARANELGPELAARIEDVRGIFLRQALGRVLP